MVIGLIFTLSIIHSTTDKVDFFLKYGRVCRYSVAKIGDSTDIYILYTYIYFNLDICKNEISYVQNLNRLSF